MKKIVEVIKELYKTPRGKGILFFLFYFIIFFVLICFLRFNHSNNSDLSSQYEKGKTGSLDSEFLLSDNYHFKYIIKLDDEESIYEGDRFEEEELFTYNGKKYYKNKDEYYVEDSKWNKTTNPYIYYDFLDIEKIGKIIDKSYLEYKTEYDSGQIKNSFLVSTNTLNKILTNKKTDIEEKPNNIIITMIDADVTNINYNLNSYCLNNKLCKKSLKIEIFYDEVDNVERIKSPIT